jgi:exodeoxyribonuclease VII small subunit
LRIPLTQAGSPRLTTISLSHFRMAKRPAPDATDATPQTYGTYEEALAELERLVADMEGGQLPLDRLVEGYRRGAELLDFCRSRLQTVEEQVKVLEQGQLKPWIAG